MMVDTNMLIWYFRGNQKAQMADALIASTADSYGEELLSGNFSHYQMIPSLSLKKFQPD